MVSLKQEPINIIIGTHYTGKMSVKLYRDLHMYRNNRVLYIFWVPFLF